MTQPVPYGVRLILPRPDYVTPRHLLELSELLASMHGCPATVLTDTSINGDLVATRQTAVVGPIHAPPGATWLEATLIVTANDVDEAKTAATTVMSAAWFNVIHEPKVSMGVAWIRRWPRGEQRGHWLDFCDRVLAACNALADMHPDTQAVGSFDTNNGREIGNILGTVQVMLADSAARIMHHGPDGITDGICDAWRVMNAHLSPSERFTLVQSLAIQFSHATIGLTDGGADHEDMAAIGKKLSDLLGVMQELAVKYESPPSSG